MTEKEYNLAKAKLDVREAESDLREAQRDLIEGYKQEQAKVASAKGDYELALATMEREYSRLKEKVERCKIQVESEQAYLSSVEKTKEEGFE